MGTQVLCSDAGHRNATAIYGAYGQGFPEAISMTHTPTSIPSHPSMAHPDAFWPHQSSNSSPTNSWDCQSISPNATSPISPADVDSCIGFLRANTIPSPIARTLEAALLQAKQVTMPAYECHSTYDDQQLPFADIIDNSREAAVDVQHPASTPYSPTKHPSDQYASALYSPFAVRALACQLAASMHQQQQPLDTMGAQHLAQELANARQLLASAYQAPQGSGCAVANMQGLQDSAAAPGDGYTTHDALYTTDFTNYRSNAPRAATPVYTPCEGFWQQEEQQCGAGAGAAGYWADTPADASCIIYATPSQQQPQLPTTPQLKHAQVLQLLNSCVNPHTPHHQHHNPMHLPQHQHQQQHNLPAVPQLPHGLLPRSSPFSHTQQAAATAPSTKAANPSARVFVGNLHQHVTESQLGKLFAVCGRVVAVKVMYNSRRMSRPRSQWRSREYGFVDFASPAQAAAAIACFHQQHLPAVCKQGQRLCVQYVRVADGEEMLAH